jgi:hypothetical protein
MLGAPSLTLSVERATIIDSVRRDRGYKAKL